MLQESVTNTSLLELAIGALGACRFVGRNLKGKNWKVPESRNRIKTADLPFQKSCTRNWQQLEAEWAKRWVQLQYYAVLNGWDASVDGIKLMKVLMQEDFHDAGLGLTELS